MAILIQKTASALEGQSGRLLCDICEIRQSNCCVSDFFFTNTLNTYQYYQNMRTFG